MTLSTIDYTIARPTLADAPLLLEFEHECNLEEAQLAAAAGAVDAELLVPQAWSLSAYRERLERRIGDPWSYYVRVVRNRFGKIVGLFDADVAQSPHDENFIDALYLAPAYRCRKIGSQLLKDFDERLANDYPLSLEVHGFNIGAQRFYQRHGFRAVAASEIGDRTTEMLTMQKTRKGAAI